MACVSLSKDTVFIRVNEKLQYLYAKASDVTIKMWAIRPTNGGVCIDGLRVDDATGFHWHSSTITKRIGNRLLETASGSRYRLLGDLDRAYARKISGYLLSVTSKFTRGFPTQWKQLIDTAKKLSTEHRTKPFEKAQNGQQMGTKYKGMESPLAGDCSVVRRSQRGRILVAPSYLRSPEYSLCTNQKDKRLDSSVIKITPESESQEIKSEENSLDETVDGTILALRRKNLLAGHRPSWKRRHSNSSDQLAKRRKVESKGGTAGRDIFLTPLTPATNVDDNVLPRQRNHRPQTEEISARIVPSVATSGLNAMGKTSFLTPRSPCTTSFIRLPNSSDEIFDDSMDTSFLDCILVVERKKSRSVTPKSARTTMKRRDSLSEIAIRNDRQNSSHRRLYPLEIGDVSNVKAKKVIRSEPKVVAKAVAMASVDVGVRRSVRLHLKAEVARSFAESQRQNSQLQNDWSVSRKIRIRSKPKANKTQNTVDLEKRMKMKRNINTEENVKPKTAARKNPKPGSGQRKPRSNSVKSGGRKSPGGRKSRSVPGQSKPETGQLQTRAKNGRSQSMANTRISVNNGSKSGRSKSQTRRSQSQTNTGKSDNTGRSENKGPKSGRSKSETRRSQSLAHSEASANHVSKSGRSKYETRSQSQANTGRSINTAPKSGRSETRRSPSMANTKISVNNGSKSGRSKPETRRSQSLADSEVSVNHVSKSGRSKSETRRSQSVANAKISVNRGSKSGRSKSETRRSKSRADTGALVTSGSKSSRPKSETRRSQSQANTGRSVDKGSKSGRSKSETRRSKSRADTEVSVTSGSRSSRSKSEASVLRTRASVGKSGNRGSGSTTAKSEASLNRSLKSGKTKTAIVKLHDIKKHLANGRNVMKSGAKNGANDFSQASKETTTARNSFTQLKGKKGKTTGKQKAKNHVKKENGVGKNRKKTQIQLRGIESSGIKDRKKNDEAFGGFESKTQPSKIKSKKVAPKLPKSRKKSEKKDNLNGKQKPLLKHLNPEGTLSKGADQFCSGTGAEISKNVDRQPDLVGACSDVSEQPQRKIQKLETVMKRRQQKPSLKNKNMVETGSKKTNNFNIGTTVPTQNNCKLPDAFARSDPGKVRCSAPNITSAVPNENQTSEFVTNEKQKPNNEPSPLVRREQVTTIKLLGGKGTLKRHRALKQLVEENMACKDRNDFFSSTPFQKVQSKPLVIPELLDDCDDIFGNIDPNLVNGLKNTDVTPHGLNRVMDYSSSKTPSDTPSMSKTPSGVKPLRKQIDAYVFNLKKKSYFDRRRKILHQNALRKSQAVNQPSTPKARPIFAMGGNVLEGVQEIPARDSDEETDFYFE